MTFVSIPFTKARKACARGGGFFLRPMSEAVWRHGGSLVFLSFAGIANAGEFFATVRKG